MTLARLTSDEMAWCDEGGTHAVTLSTKRTRNTSNTADLTSSSIFSDTS